MPPAKRILNDEIRAAILALMPRYADRRALTLPALHMVNERLGHVPPEAVSEIAELLELAPAQIQDTLSFYEFFPQDRPVGKYRVWMCRSISCAVRESEQVFAYLAERLGIAAGQTTADGLVTLENAECLGGCDFAPVMLVNDTLWKNMTRERVEEFLTMVRSGNGTSGLSKS